MFGSKRLQLPRFALGGRWVWDKQCTANRACVRRSTGSGGVVRPARFDTTRLGASALFGEFEAVGVAAVVRPAQDHYGVGVAQFVDARMDANREAGAATAVIRTSGKYHTAHNFRAVADKVCRRRSGARGSARRILTEIVILLHGSRAPGRPAPRMPKRGERPMNDHTELQRAVDGHPRTETGGRGFATPSVAVSDPWV